MAGVLDFLFEGKPPASVNTYGQTVENIPKWLSDYTQGLVGRANAVAAEPYMPYEGPRIAGFSPDQLAAFEGVRSNQGNWEDPLNYARQTFEEVGGINPLEMAAPYLQQGAESWPGNVDAYMDPYIEHVLNRQETLSNRNLTENILPAVQDAFIGSGSFGGDRMAEITSRVARDAAEGLQGQQLGALSAAYGQGADIFGQDQSRKLQSGIATGNLAGQTGELGLATGKNMGALAEALQRMGITDTASLEAIGAQQQGLGQRSLDTAYGDFREQRDYPRETIDWMNSVIRGMPYNRSVNTTETGPANIYQPSPLSQLASMYSVYRGLNPQQGG